MAISFHEQDSFTVEREADAGELFDTADRVAVEELEGARDDAGGDDS